MSVVQTAIDWYVWSVTGFWGWTFSEFAWCFRVADCPPPVRGYVILSATTFAVYAAYSLFVLGWRGRWPGIYHILPASLVWGPAFFPLAAGVAIATWPAILLGFLIYWLGKISAVRRCECGRRMKARHKFCAACGEGADGRVRETTKEPKENPTKDGSTKQEPPSECLDHVGRQSFKPGEVKYLIQTDSILGRLVTVYSNHLRPAAPFQIVIDATINGCGGIKLVRLRGDEHPQLGYSGYMGSRFRMFLPGEKVVMEEDSS